MFPPPPLPASRVAAPTRPSEAQRPGFPLIATLAPVVMSLVLWAVTQSAYALMFAALGPGIAIASRCDARRGEKRRVRGELVRFDSELAAARLEIAAAHDRDRASLASLAPSAVELLRGPTHVHWGGTAAVRLRLGSADLPSAVTLDGVGDLRANDAIVTALRDLRDETVSLRAAPVIVDAGAGIGIAGPPALVSAFTRALVVQLLATCSPATHSVTGAAAWLQGGPHRCDDGSESVITVGDVNNPRLSVTIATAREPAALPAAVDTIVVFDGAHATTAGQRFTPELLSVEQARAWLALAAKIAARNGLAASADDAPSTVGFVELAAAAVPGDLTSLACAIGLDHAGPVIVDLVLDGPHAIVGGTTGSGKSELLMTWLLAMGSLYPPDRVNFLLFDFKGGSSFGSVPTLPHCVGIVTDLDPGGVERAVASLAAELRHRERVLATASARSIEQVAELPRLVIVVDEFAAMAVEVPALHDQLADIAARGRSLGVHLVLCTQRPAGVVRDAVLANASLRISLRVNNRADSMAVIGSDEAASSRAVHPGRAWLTKAGAPARALQVALVTPHDIDEVAARWGDGEERDWRPRRPWLDPLAPTIAASDFPGAVAVLDLPADQAQRAVSWHPQNDGNLLVIGAARAGKSNVLRVIEGSLGLAGVAPGVEAAWDALVTPAPVVLIDDVDLVLAQLSSDFQQAFVDLLATALRSPSTRVALTAQRLSSSLQQLAALCDDRLLLRMPSRHEHVIAGGSTADFDAHLRPGGGHWRGARAQVLLAEHQPASRAMSAAALPHVPLPHVPLLAVSTRPRALAEFFSAVGREVTTLSQQHEQQHGELPEVVICDPDGWQAHWAQATALAAERHVLFHECSVAEFRQLSRQRRLPPPIADPSTTAWLLDPHGEVRRVQLPPRTLDRLT